MNAKELAWELQHIPYSDESATELIKAYGKREIEKDRERVKANVTCSIPSGQGSYECYEVDLDSIDQTPIDLD